MEKYWKGDAKRLFFLLLMFYIFNFLMNHAVLFVNKSLIKHGSTTKHTFLRKGKLMERNHKRIKRNVFIDPGWKYVIVWNKILGRSGALKRVFKRHFRHECEVEKCHITTDQSYLKHADAIIIDGNSLAMNAIVRSIKYYPLPPERHPNQRFILFMQDPPTMYSMQKFDALDNYFNWTMTYRADSDVVAPYGKVIKTKDKRPVKYLTQEELDKKKMAIWLESHCFVQSRRSDFVNELQKYIPVNVFGKCVNKTCGSNQLLFIGNVGKDSCEQSFTNYRFYLALENSFCKDYVTEKFYRSLKLGIVPITYGAVNYSEVSPPNSFIDAKEFASVFDLARHLEKVSNNVTLYNSYLKWQEDYEVDVGFPYKTHVCDLCKKLHSEAATRKKVYRSIREWYGEEGNCYEFNKFKLPEKSHPRQ